MWEADDLCVYVCVVMQAAAATRGKGEYPERVGHPECQVRGKTTRT